MTPVKPGDYVFSKESLVKVRSGLGLSQAKMGERLGVPKNTVSRWETGETAPDAHSLAAIYSLAQKKGIVANFFAPTKPKTPVRNAALVYWDSEYTREDWNGETKRTELDKFIRHEVRKRVPKAERQLFKVFTSTSREVVSDQLEKLNWRVWEREGWSDTDWSEEIYDQALSDAGHSPANSVVFLVTQDTDHVDLIEDLRERDVRVYLFAPSSVSQELVAAVGKRRWIKLDLGPAIPGLPYPLSLR